MTSHCSPRRNKSLSRRHRKYGEGIWLASWSNSRRRPCLRAAVSQLFIESLAARKPTADSADDDLLLGLASLWPQTADNKAAAASETIPAYSLPRFHVTPSLFAVTRGTSRKEAAASKTTPASDSEPATRQRPAAMTSREGTIGSPRDATAEPPP